MHRKKILVVDDEKLIRWSIQQKLAEWNLDSIEAESGTQGFQRFEQESPDLIILDVNLPDRKGTDLLLDIKHKSPETPVVMITAYGSIDDAVSSMREGAYDFITKPIDFLKLQNTLNNALETASLKKEVAFYKEKAKPRFDMQQIVGISQQMREIFKMTKTIASSEATIVLLQGESGTGKDLIAQALHHLSRRESGPYLVINCSAIPETLLESELFGYEKGAFTDAKNQKKGLVELAHTGTLFLDEISTLGLPLQAKLLRFLETQTFKRVGGLTDIEVDIRVVAATNQDLEIASQSEEFRRDLFYRLNVCPITIPPLRDRLDDILPLAQHFIKEFNLKFNKQIKGLNKKAEKMLLDYPWPGNVRELKNALERAMIFEEGTLVTAKFLPIRLSQESLISKPKITAAGTEAHTSLEDMEKTLLVKALKNAKGNKSHAARILDISRDTLRYRLKKWQIRAEDYMG